MKTTLKIGVATAALALALTACSNDSPVSDPNGFGDLTLQLSFIKNTQNAGEYIADDSGYYKDEGFDDVDLIAGPTAVEASVATGSADVGFTTTLGAATVITAEDMPIKIVGAVYNTNAFTIMSMAGDGAITTPQDLKGKTIGVTAGTAEIIIEAFLAANGMVPADVTFAPAEGNPALLTGGEVDGYFGLVTNELLTLELQGHDIVSLPLAENGLPLTGTVFAVTDEAIKDNRERIKAFLRAEIRGWTDEINDPEKGADLALTTYGADLGLDEAKEHAQAHAQLEFVYPESLADAGLFMLTDDVIAANITALGQARIDIAAEELFDMSLLKEIYDESPELLQVKGS